MFDATHPLPTVRPLQQHPNFARALRLCGQSPVQLDNGMLVLRRRVLGLPVAMLSRVALPPDCTTTLRGLLENAGLCRSLLILAPDKPTPELAVQGAVPLMTPATLAEIDLSVSQARLHANLHQKWRNRLNHATRHNLRVTRQPLTPSNGKWLLRADAAQQAQRGYRSWPTSLTLAYAQASPKQAMLFTALQQGEPLAAMLFLRHGNGATYHIGHTTARGRAVSAHNLLMWNAMTWLSVQGHSVLELGLISDTAPGLTRFKLGCGARPRELGGTWGWWPPLGRALRPLALLDRRKMA